jgi:hypothetical protein
MRADHTYGPTDGKTMAKNTTPTIKTEKMRRNTVAVVT